MADLKTERDVLAELVWLKDLHDRIESIEDSDEGIRGLSEAELDQHHAWIVEYDRRKPLAWAAAREVLNRRAQDVRGEAMEPIDYDALEQTLEHMAGGMDRQLHGDMIDALCDAATAISRLRSKLAEWEGDGIEKDAAISALRAAAGEPPKEPPPGACE